MPGWLECMRDATLVTHHSASAIQLTDVESEIVRRRLIEKWSADWAGQSNSSVKNLAARLTQRWKPRPVQRERQIAPQSRFAQANSTLGNSCQAEKSIQNMNFEKC